jgi:hypothetical protein
MQSVHFRWLRLTPDPGSSGSTDSLERSADSLVGYDLAWTEWLILHFLPRTQIMFCLQQFSKYPGGTFGKRPHIIWQKRDACLDWYQTVSITVLELVSTRRIAHFPTSRLHFLTSRQKTHVLGDVLCAARAWYTNVRLYGSIDVFCRAALQLHEDNGEQAPLSRGPWLTAPLGF